MSSFPFPLPHRDWILERGCWNHSTSGYQYQYDFWNPVTCFGLYLPHLSKLPTEKQPRVLESWPCYCTKPFLSNMNAGSLSSHSVAYTALYSLGPQTEIYLLFIQLPWPDFYPQKEHGGLCQYFSPPPSPSPTFPTHIIPWEKFQEDKVDFKLSAQL